MRLSLISGIESASCFAINASKRPCRRRKVALVVQSCSARAVSWAARPLAVGSRPVEHGMNTESNLSFAHVGSVELHLNANQVRCRLLGRAVQAAESSKPSAPCKNSMLSAARGPAAYRSAEVSAKMRAPASTPAQRGV